MNPVSLFDRRTILLGAAKVLAQARATFGGTIKLIFQPDEEHGYGARDVVKAGAAGNAFPYVLDKRFSCNEVKRLARKSGGPPA